MKNEVITRFLHYISYDTTSDDSSNSFPSTKNQIYFAQVLVKELKAIGLSGVNLDEKGYIMATLPANTAKPAPTIGFIAHMDTAPEYTGKNIKPQIIKAYPGGDILLNRKLNIYLREKEFPELQNYRGQDLITTDGTTLLGADDKAGIAEIITAMNYLIKHPEILHGQIRIAFTPDEEIGKGADFFNVKKFNANFAYTVDGGELGQIEIENFNAATAEYIIYGRNVHPGTAKNKMVNSMLKINDIISYFPKKETPAETQLYEGFFHLHQINGSVEETSLRYLIRDHDKENFYKRKTMAHNCMQYINNKYGDGTVSLNIKDSYYNMKEIIDKHPEIVNLAINALKEVGIKPLLAPIRGGTDGARLSYMGLPTPNLFTGGHNFHGKYEFIPIPSMVKAVETIVMICKLGPNFTAK